MNNNSLNYRSCKFSLNCYTFIYFYDHDKFKYLERSNKIVLPSSVLNKINKYSDKLDGNIIFQVSGNSDIIMNLSVDSFIDDISDAYIPTHIMDTLFLEEGSQLEFKLNVIDKGTKIILEPHTSNFLEIENSKEFLEKQLNEKYDILSCGETISLLHNNDLIKFNIILTEPKNTICIKNTDIIVDFKEPLDYKEYLFNKQEEKKRKIEEDKIKQQLIKQEENAKIEKQKNDEKIKKEKGYIPFGGIGRKLGN